MSLNVNLKNCFSVISTDRKEITKNSEIIEFYNCLEKVEIVRIPSKSTIQSLPLVYTNNLGFKALVKPNAKAEFVEETYQQLLINSAVSIESVDYEVCDVKSMLPTNNTSNNTSNSPKLSKRSYVYKKLKDTIIGPLLRRKAKDNLEISILPIGNLFEEIESGQALLSSKESCTMDSISDRLPKRISQFTKDSYNRHKSVFNDRKYQLALPKTSQTTEIRGNIESVLDPETDIVLIRKDISPDGLKVDSINDNDKFSHVLNASNNSLLADVSSSSLNMSSTDNESATQGSFENTAYNFANRESSIEINGMYNSSNGDDVSETDLNNASTTVPTRATTRAATIVGHHSSNFIASNMIHSEGSTTSSRVARGATSPAIVIERETSNTERLSPTTSSSSSSYCSIMQSPVHMIKSAIEE